MHRAAMVFLLLFCSIIFADEGSVTGKISDSSGPLPGANVFLVGTSMGATTDSLGNYLIGDVPVGKYTLQVDFIGYESSSLDLYISMSDIASEELFESNFSAKLGLESDESSDII